MSYNITGLHNKLLLCSKSVSNGIQVRCVKNLYKTNIASELIAGYFYVYFVLLFFCLFVCCGSVCLFVLFLVVCVCVVVRVRIPFICRHFLFH